MPFTIRIDTGNAAFTDDPGDEIARILERIADEVRNGRIAGRMSDINGNSVASFGEEPAE